MDSLPIVPLIIDGQDILLSPAERQGTVANRYAGGPVLYQGATRDLALRAAQSSAQAFTTWSKTTPIERRTLLFKLALILRDRADEIKRVCCKEIHCGALWADIITNDSIGLIEEYAALTTSVATGSIPHTQQGYGLVMKEPLGVVLGIAPWNAPIILGLRSVVAPIAAGNVAILKGSELSPQTHYLLASMFRDAGFPPGVLNFLLHRPEDAPEIFDVLINHPAIKKCNFTGSTQVGRIIASQAAMALKPVLLELGGKNFTVVLDDADLDLAAREITKGAFLNNGQICMSTDMVLVTTAVASALEARILAILREIDTAPMVISPAAKAKLEMLVSDARAKGAEIHIAPQALGSTAQSFPPTVVTGLTADMKLYEIESFGPVVGIVSVQTEDQIVAIIQEAKYGLSSSIISRNHYRALELAGSIKAGAVHINSMTVHDEPTLPHGGYGDSGWGRFGARWGLEEFVQTKVVTLHP
ncbi:putative aldehyde dehydrogenase [Aspergillus homomorphus CBS 101889]|uniref:Putative aldehyde dehydrogenase n=1 Tax=Aspergillus homomorphus (strain CBS 101889) TaxID=1450537 RepID=A0A395I2I9_ASPHC|nr:putative aldehyde dehydrogenase [Aspergillus homomorphus CBS 101889]RAL13945.1 putative aldehyde dehydrogenase [Aspergillus homomorphus CBS 101889]